MRNALALCTSLSLLVAAPAWAQRPAAVERPARPASPALAPERAAVAADYRIGPDDELSVSVLQAPELNGTSRVSQQGSISLPLIGGVRASGLTASELESAIEEQLGSRFIKNPEVTVLVTEIRSRPVSVVGAVVRPGVVQVGGETSLLDVISMAGGLRDDAGDTAVVLRKAEGESAAPIEVRLKPLLESRDPGLNVAIRPGDVVTVRVAEVVYVVGAVKKPGAFAMQGNDRLTVLQALALGEGLEPTAAQKDAIVVRTSEGGAREEIAVDLNALLKGRRPDVPLRAHDVLFVPTSGGKVAARTALDAIVRVLSWRPF